MDVDVIRKTRELGLVSMPGAFTASEIKTAHNAGADYVIDDDNTGGVNIEFEKMYAMAANADYWRILNSYPGDFSYEALRESEPRNELFKAFRERKVIYCNMKQTPYYEKAPVEPDVVLADLLAIFHPELAPQGYEPTFYRLLP